MLSPTRLSLPCLFHRATLLRFQSTKSVLQTPKLSSNATGWEQGEELLEEYPPTVNGYFQANVGDTLGSYRIFRKLGWGMYSTVWLAESQRCVPHYCSTSAVLKGILPQLQPPYHSGDICVETDDEYNLFIHVCSIEY